MTKRLPCKRCGAEKPPGRKAYCSDECRTAALKEQTRAKDDLRIGKCKRCGQQKEAARIRGARYCAACRDLIAATASDLERERGRRRSAAKTAARIAAGEMVPAAKEYRPGQQWCRRCELYLPLEDFPERGRGKGGYMCLPCQRGYNQARSLRTNYGLTIDEYDFILATQDGRCAICEGRPRKYRLHVDHDHKTGEIRGLLCSRCNHKLLGSANDDPSRLRKAADYLEAGGVREVFGHPRFVPGYGETA